MTRTRRHTWLRTAFGVLIALGVAVPLPSAAFAAPGAPLESASLQLDPGTAGSAGILIITGTLPATTPLPATVRLALPQGMAIRWAGEVLGGALEDDPSIQPAIEHGENGYDIAVLTLTQGRRAQVELDATGSVVQAGDVRTIRLAWAPVDAVGSVDLMTAVPLGATIETMTAGATTGPGPSNGTLISLETSAAPGTESALEVVYKASAAPAGAAATSQGSSAPLIIIFGSLAALFVFFGVAVSRRTRTTAAADSDEDLTDEALDGPAAESAAPAAASAPEGDADPEAPMEAEGPRRRFSPKVIILVVVALILGGAAISMISGEAPGTTRTTNEYVYKVLTSADADASVTFPITLSEGDPAHESIHVFEAFAGLPGVRSVKLLFAGPAVEIKYDSSLADEAAINAALTAAGYGS